MLDKADLEPDLFELVKQKVYTDNCSGHKICVLTFMPNIYDSSADERNGYLDTLKQVAKKMVRQPFEFFWL